MSPALRFAGRELRGGVAGFRVFLACLSLGVAALASAGSVAEAFRYGLADQSRSILGGDIAASVEGRRFGPRELAALGALGREDDTLRVRAMAQGPTGERRLAEVRGVDAAYPLVGRVGLGGGGALSTDLADTRQGPGAVVEPALMQRLGLRLGQPFLLGDARFVLRGVITGEPDRLGRGFALGPGVIVARPALERSGLLAADSLFGETVRVALPKARDPGRAIAGLQKALAPGVRLRGRSDAAAGLRRLVDQLEYFLSFIGLASLLAGGLGVSAAVSSFLETRKTGIAVLKAMGADAGTVRDVYLLQIGALAALGVAIGAAVGAVVPLVLGRLYASTLPIPALFAVYPAPLLRAALFGLLAAAAFSLVPLARARATPPAALLRRDLAGHLAIGPELLGAALSAAGLVALTVLSAPTRLTAAAMVLAVVFAFAVLWALGRGAASLAGRLRGGARGALRIGLANLAGPHSAARTASPAIGLAIALLVTVVLVQASLLRQIRTVAPESAPALVFTQIPPERAAAFDAEVARAIGPLTPDRFRRSPFATGRITALNGRPVDLARIRPDQRWAFDQDITLSALPAAPPDARVTAGAWWPVGYAGPPQVMLDARIAQGAGLHVGDHLTLSLLGRDLDARVAGLRRVDWGGFGASFPLIVDPAAVAGAGLRDVAIAKATPPQEAALTRRLGRDFAEVNVISVREQLEAAARLFDQLALAVRAAAGVAGAAGALVLLGALLASAGARKREAAVLQVLGATRADVLAAYAFEYFGVGAIAALVGALLGAAAAWPVVTLVFKAQWRADWGALAFVFAGVTALTALAGAVSAAGALSRAPSAALRSE